MLLLVYVFNFVDRQILGILAGPIKADLQLSDTQLGVLGGLAFAILYSTMAIPLAGLADRRGRARVIAGSLAVWSAFTALCGTAAGFWQLFLCRLGVGVGEAGGVAPSYALIADTFPPRQRARAMAVYSLGIPLGAALGILLGGYVAARVDWRAAFLATGAAGLVLAPLFAWAVRDKPPSAERAAVRLRTTIAILAPKPSFWLLAFGAGASSMLSYGLAFWLPSLLQRSFGLDLLATSRLYGGVLLVGGTLGVLAGGWLGDLLGRGSRRAYVLVPAAASLLAAPLYLAAVLAGGGGSAFWLLLLPQALAFVWLGPVLTAVQHLVPAPMRASASACFLLINNLIGVGFGALSIGRLSDALAPAYGTEALRYAILAALGLYVVSAVLMAASARALPRDWVD